MELPLESPATPPRHPAWPERLLELLRSGGETPRDEDRRDFWLLLNLVLLEKLRFHGRRLGPPGSAELHDLATGKALELVGKLDCGQWKPLERSAGELVNFISTIARNAIVDELRWAGRTVMPTDAEELDRRASISRAPEAAEAYTERREFISRLLGCARRLRPEHRTIWLLRVLHELPSRAIAAHPEVRLKPGHVDVILGRCREQIRGCLKTHGIESGALPPGTFAELWNQFRYQPSSSEGRHDG